MDPATADILARLDGLRRERAAINHEFAQVRDQIRARKALLESLDAARDALAERHNALRSKLAGELRPPEATSEATAERQIPPAEALPAPIVTRGQRPALVLFDGPRLVERLEFDPRHLDDALRLLLGFRALTAPRLVHQPHSQDLMPCTSPSQA